MTADRTWTLAVSGGGLSIFTEAQRKALESRSIYASDEEDALESLADILGISLIPCCEDDDPPCAVCEKALRAEADDRAVDRAIEEARRRDDEERVQKGIEP